MVVGPFNPQGVVSDEFGLAGGELARIVAGKDVEQGFFGCLFLAELFARSAGAVGAEVGEGIEREGAVGPGYFELSDAVEVEPGGGPVGGRGNECGSGGGRHDVRW